MLGVKGLNLIGLASPFIMLCLGPTECTVLLVKCVIKGQFYKGIQFYGHFPVNLSKNLMVKNLGATT